MAKFHDLIKVLNENPESAPDNILDELVTEYNTAFDGYNATVAEKDEKVKMLESEVGRVKATNFDLLTQVASGEAKTPHDDLSDEDHEITIESLFKRK